MTLNASDSRVGGLKTEKEIKYRSSINLMANLMK